MSSQTTWVVTRTEEVRVIASTPDEAVEKAGQRFANGNNPDRDEYPVRLVSVDARPSNPHSVR
jgi:hypothetical protein